jgi:hypothetical protein
MSHWVYSAESLPNEELIGKPGYNPECFMWGGIRLPFKKGWQKFPDTFTTIHRQSWRDRPIRDIIQMRDSDDEGKTIKGLARVIEERYASRGVVVLDHEPQPSEKLKLQIAADEANLAFRMQLVEQYEERLKQRAVGELVPVKVTPYEDECYDILGLTKPYSVEALRAQRHPGQAVGEQIVAALDRLMTRKQAEATQQPLPVTEPEPVALPTE